MLPPHPLPDSETAQAAADFIAGALPSITPTAGPSEDGPQDDDPLSPQNPLANDLTAQQYYDNILAPVLGPYPYSDEDAGEETGEDAGYDAGDPPADINFAPANQTDAPTIGEIMDNPGLFAVAPDDPD
eukprot:gene31761-6959_t